MQPYIPYIVLEALVFERVREAERLNRQSAFPLAHALRRRSGAMLIRIGTWLQQPVPDPVPEAI